MIQKNKIEFLNKFRNCEQRHINTYVILLHDRILLLIIYLFIYLLTYMSVYLFNYILD